MPANQYGSLNYFLSIVTISTAVGILGLDSTLTTFLAKGITKMLSEAVFLTWMAAIVLAVFMLLIFASLPLMLTSLGVLFSVFSAAEILGNRSYREYMIVLIAQKLVSIVSVPLLYSFYGIDGALYGYAISYFPVCYRFFASTKKISFSISTFRPIKKFFFHSFGVGISRVLPLFSDKLIILPLFGVSILGYYQFGIQVLSVISVIPVILYHYLLPQEAAENKSFDIKKVERLGVISSVSITIILMILTPTIITHLFPEYKKSTLSTQIVLLAAIPLSISALFNSSLLAKEKSFQVLMASAIFLVTQYIFIGALGWIYGLLGLSLSTVIASIIQAVFLVLVNRKISAAKTKISEL